MEDDQKKAMHANTAPANITVQPHIASTHNFDMLTQHTPFDLTCMPNTHTHHLGGPYPYRKPWEGHSGYFCLTEF